jgi:peptidoglycan hydrolase-like protein with peptidoglycan-binding domain
MKISSGRAQWSVMGRTAICFLAVGCAHSTSADDGEPGVSHKTEAKTEAKTGAKTGAKSGAKTGERQTNGARTDSAPVVPRRVRSSDRDGAPELATSPAGLLQPKAIDGIQDALVSRGLLSGAEKSGTLDEKTKQAIRELQRRNGLPATGLPDDATIRRLDLDPARVFVVSDGGRK